MFTQNICAPQSSIMNASCINILTQTEAQQEVAYKKEQELFMTTPPGLSACVLTVMAPGMDACQTEIDFFVDVKFSGLQGHFYSWS